MASASLLRVATLLGCICLLIGAASGAEESEEVVTLTDENFEHLVSSGKWLVEFYAPWCGHCKKLAPVYEEAAGTIKKTGGKLRLGKVDCTVNKKLASQFSIRGYPTLKYLRGDIVTDYTSGRTLKDLLEFNRIVSQPSVSEIKEAGLQGLLGARDEVRFILLSDNTDIQNAFTSIAGKLQDQARFLMSVDAALAKKYHSQYAPEQSPDSTLLVVVNDLEVVPYTGAFDEESLSKWIWENRGPVMVELGASNFRSVTTNNKLTAVLLVDTGLTDTTNANNIKALSKKFREQFTFAWLSNLKYPEFVEKFGVKKSELPVLVVLDAPNQIHYVNTTIADNPKKIEKFLDDVLAGNVPAQGDASVWGWVKRNSVYLAIAAAAIVTVITVATLIIYAKQEPTAQKPKEQ